MKRVMVCLDLSDLTDDVIKKAIQIGKSTGAVMEIAYVSSIHTEKVTHVVSSDNQQKVAISMQKENNKLNSCAAKIRKAGLECEISLLHGNVSDSLIKRAKDFDADMIIIGSRTTNAATHVIKGSVGADLLKELKIPVLLVPALQ